MMKISTDSAKVFPPALWAMEPGDKNFAASLYDSQGERYYALVKAQHFPGAYAKAKRIAKDQGFALGHIAKV